MTNPITCDAEARWYCEALKAAREVEALLARAAWMADQAERYTNAETPDLTDATDQAVAMTNSIKEAIDLYEDGGLAAAE